MSISEHKRRRVVAAVTALVTSSLLAFTPVAIGVSPLFSASPEGEQNNTEITQETPPAAGDGGAVSDESVSSPDVSNGDELPSAEPGVEVTVPDQLLAQDELPMEPAPVVGDYLDMHKLIDSSSATKELKPGDTFVYQLVPACNQFDCLNTVIEDRFPVALAGFEVLEVEGSPGPNTVPVDIEWIVNGSDPTTTAPTTIQDDTMLRVSPKQPLAAGGEGLREGQRFTVNVTMRVPANLDPTDARNGVEITNTACAKADNTLSSRTGSIDGWACGSIAFIPVVAKTLDLTVSKSWSSVQSTLNAGNPAQVNLGITNTSNVPVQSMSLQEPQSPAKTKDQLSNTNPFELFNFSSLDCGAPLGTNPTVDAWVFDQQGVGSWVTGTGGCSLPATVNSEDVAGLRISYLPTDGTEIGKGVAAAPSLQLVQREAKRSDGSTLPPTSDQTINNTVSGSVVHSDVAPGSKSTTASSQHTIKADPLTGTIQKSFAPDKILPGQESEGTIAVQNTGADATKIVVRDLNFFSANGFALQSVSSDHLPAGFATGEVKFYPSGQTSPFDAANPASAPEGTTGFEVTMNGHFSAGDQTVVKFGVRADNAFANKSSINTASAVISDGVRELPITTTAKLSTHNPAIALTVKKTTNPSESTAVRPGRTVNTTLETTLSSTLVNVKKLVIGDQLSGDKTFWDAFDLYSVGRTEVYQGQKMDIEVLVGQEWIALTSVDATDNAKIVELDNTALTGLATNQGISDLEKITGIRFVITSDTSLAAQSIVVPQLGFKARTALRSDGAVLTHPEVTKGVPPTPSNLYENTASATAEGTSDSGVAYSTFKSAKSSARVIGTPISDGGGVNPGGPGSSTGAVDKHWNKASLTAQKGETASTTLRWRVNAGFDKVQITDSAALGDPLNSPEDVSRTVFDAFDLKEIKPIEASALLDSSGWALKYDSIESIELYKNGTWEDVTPVDGWIQNGRFVGYRLSADDQAATTGVRITIVPNEEARTADQSLGAPEPGTGVVSSKTAYRDFVLEWSLRNQTRSAAHEWVNSTASLNLPDTPGVVENMFSLHAYRDGKAEDLRDSASISIVDGPLNVDVSILGNTTGNLVVPAEGAPVSQYPERQYTITGWVTSDSNAQRVRLTWPAATADWKNDCSTETTSPKAVPGTCVWGNADISQNPLNRMALTSLALVDGSGAQIDLSQSVVTLYRYANGVVSGEEVAGDMLSLLTADDLKSVIAVSAIFEGKDSAASGGVITQKTKLSIVAGTQVRESMLDGTPRDYVANATVQRIHNAIVQPYNLALGTYKDTKVGDHASTPVALTSGIIDLVLKKSINGASSAVLLERNRDTALQVTLDAKHGNSSAPTKQVMIRDNETSDFWSTFEFVSLTALAFPSDSDLLVITYQGDSLTSAQRQCTPNSTADCSPLPEDLAKIKGMELTFLRSDGSVFADSPGWNSTVTFGVKVRPEVKFPSTRATYVNTARAQSTGKVTDVEGQEAKSAERDWSASVVLDPGTAQVKIGNLANDGNRTVRVGELFPLDVTVNNSGTGYLDVENLTVDLPDWLVHTGNAPAGLSPWTFVPDTTGTLQETPSLSYADGKLVFTWSDGQRLSPGETAKLRIYLVLEAGLINGQMAEVTATVTTEQPLSTCALYTPGGGPGYQPGGQAKKPVGQANACATVDSVGPTSGPNLHLVKAVKGQLEGAVNVIDSSQECIATIESNGEKYYQYPCVARSQIGGTDTWVLRLSNGGTTKIHQAQVFDDLPADGDSYIIGSIEGPISRGSDFHPVLNSAPSIPNRATGTKVMYSTVAEACNDTWGSLSEEEPCQNADWTENWPADLESTTAIRIDLDFGAEGLAPGETIDIHYTTVNRLTDTDGPSVEQGEINHAWNQFGVRYLDSDVINPGTVRNVADGSGTQNEWLRLAPGKVGLQTETGSLSVSKEVTGEAKDLAPAAFSAEVSCSVTDGETTLPVTFGDEGEVKTLILADGATERITGIPLGAECSIVEADGHGATESTINRPTVRIEVADPEDSTGEVDANQQVTITNRYGFGSLSITKSVQTEADKDDLLERSYEFSLACNMPDEQPIDIGEYGTFALADGETLTIRDLLPVGSVCQLEETDSDDADEVILVGNNLTLTESGATIIVGDGETSISAVTVTNRFDSGTFTVKKEAIGEGVDKYGRVDFDFHATCTRDGEILLEEDFELASGESNTFGVFPSGTECTVNETDAEGASEQSITDAGRVLIRSGETTSMVVTATNIFRVGDIEVRKLREGPAADTYGDGPFIATVECTYDDGDGDAPDVYAPQQLVLEAANNYRAVVRDLPVGTVCKVSETQEAGGVPIEVLEPVTIVEDPDGAPAATSVTLRNHFDGGYVDVIKKVTGTAAAKHQSDRFGFKSTCTWPEGTGEGGLGGSDVEEFYLSAGQTHRLGIYPVGTECVVDEVDAKGATVTTIAQEGKVKIESSGGEEASVATILVTNEFGDTGLKETGANAIGLAVVATLTLGIGVAFLLVAKRRRIAE